MRPFLAVSAICILLTTPVMADNQLYTGDATTVPLHRFQFQLFQDSTPSQAYRFAGTSLAYGVSDNAEVRVALGRLWSNISPDAKVGPNIGAKWRLAGDGRVEPSLAVSALISRSDTSGGSPAGPDYGALLIGSYPSRYLTLLGNFGRVWVDGPKPDAYYMSFAGTRRLNLRTLFALQYSDLRRIGSVPNKGVDAQYSVGLVYAPDRKTSYSLQLGYLPNNPKFHFRTTLGFAVYF